MVVRKDIYLLETLNLSSEITERNKTNVYILQCCVLLSVPKQHNTFPFFLTQYFSKMYEKPKENIHNQKNEVLTNKTLIIVSYATIT